MKTSHPMTWIGAAAFLFAALIPAVMAQAPYPNQQIKIICAFPAGGGTDITSRLLGEQLHKILGQPVIVDNRTGASGMVGTGAAAKSPPDGYTLLVASGEMAVNPHLYKQMAYDWEKDLQPMNFFGFFAPAGIPDSVLRRLNAAAVQALKMPELVTRLRNLGFEPSPNTPEQFREFIRNESAKFAKIIVDANVKLEQ